MWRLILATFAFLGWSFYVLSGGADYEPRVESIQARAKLNDVRPRARQTETQLASAESAEETAEEESVTRALSSLDNLDISSDGQAQITLASADANDASGAKFESDIGKVDILTQTPEIAQAGIILDGNAEPSPSARDIRRVTGTVVNLRDGPSTFYLAVGKLRQGDEVEVLEASDDGWLKIHVTESGQTGWMADWLVTAAAN